MDFSAHTYRVKNADVYGTCFFPFKIYKSTKCNDVLNSGYCPRGPFCAFAHADSEMTLGRTYLQGAANQQAALAASPRQQEASPVSSSSTSASSSGFFSPTVRPLQGQAGGSRVSPAGALPSHVCAPGKLLIFVFV